VNRLSRTRFGISGLQNEQVYEFDFVNIAYTDRS
jgi:hypothetical protein